MRNFLLVTALLALSTSVAFAGGWAFGGSNHGVSLSQSATVTQKIGNTGGGVPGVPGDATWVVPSGAKAINKSTIIQLQVPVNSPLGMRPE